MQDRQARRQRHARPALPQAAGVLGEVGRAVQGGEGLMPEHGNRLKQFRRIATRYEKRGVNYLTMDILGMILLWL